MTVILNHSSRPLVANEHVLFKSHLQNTLISSLAFSGLSKFETHFVNAVMAIYLKMEQP